MQSLIGQLVTGLTALAVLGLAPPALGNESDGDSVVEACYTGPIGQVNDLPGGDPPQEDWCHPLFSEVNVETALDTLRVSWLPQSSQVYWPCGFQYAWQHCDVDRYEVHIYTWIRDRGDRLGWSTDSRKCLVPSTSRECEFTGLVAGKSYMVNLRAYIENGTWFKIKEMSATVPAPPSAPGSVGVSVVGSAVDVEWSSPSDWGGANELSYRVSTSPESGTCEVVAVGACRLEDVPRGVPLTVQVIASNVAGSSAPASSAPVTVPVTAPDSPGVVTAKYPKPGTAKVSWTAPANDGGKPITRYTVTAKPGKQTCSTSGTQSCVIKGLTSGKSYSFTVKAKNAIGTSAASPAGVAGVLVGPSSSPRKVNASPSGGSATISWNKPSKSGGGKLVEYVARAGSQTCTTKKKKCKINGLALGRTYQVTVTAVTTGGRSKPATTTVTTIAPIPPKPQQDIT